MIYYLHNFFLHVSTLSILWHTCRPPDLNEEESPSRRTLGRSLNACQGPPRWWFSAKPSVIWYSRLGRRTGIRTHCESYGLGNSAYSVQLCNSFLGRQSCQGPLLLIFLQLYVTPYQAVLFYFAFVICFSLTILNLSLHVYCSLDTVRLHQIFDPQCASAQVAMLEFLFRWDPSFPPCPSYGPPTPFLSPHVSRWNSGARMCTIYFTSSIVSVYPKLSASNDKGLGQPHDG